MLSTFLLFLTFALIENNFAHIGITFLSSFTIMLKPKNSEEKGETSKIGDVWASMEARRASSSAIDETDIRLMKAFGEQHSPFSENATRDMEIIGSNTICRKCMLFTNVCYTLGHHLKECNKEIFKDTFSSGGNM